MADPPDLVALAWCSTIHPQAPRADEGTLSELIEKYDLLADTFSEREYASFERYFGRRAAMLVRLAPRLQPGDAVLDLGCGDGALAAPLASLGIEYTGVDASARMIEVARARQPGAQFEVATLDELVPARTFDAVVAFRSFYFAADRPAFFARMRNAVRKKFVFDFDPRVHDEDALKHELRAAGFGTIRVRPFMTPQRRSLPVPVQRMLWGVEPLPGARILFRIGLPPRLLVIATP